MLPPLHTHDVVVGAAVLWLVAIMLGAVFHFFT